MSLELLDYDCVSSIGLKLCNCVCLNEDYYIVVEMIFKYARLVVRQENFNQLHQP